MARAEALARGEGLGGSAAEGAFGLDREEPFVEEKLEAEARGERLGTGKEGELSKIGEDQGIESPSFFCGELGAEKVLGDFSCGREGRIVIAQFREGIQKARILQKMDLLLPFFVDPFSDEERGSKGSEGELFSHERDQPRFRGENFQNLLTSEIGNRAEDDPLGFFFHIIS